MQRRHALFALSAIGLLSASACTRKDAASADPPAAPAELPPARELSAAEARQAYQAAGGGNGFTAGPIVAANTVFVFFDPQCPHCGALWTASQPLLGKLKMVWLPVAILRPVSAPQGALLLSAPNPVAAMTEHEASLMDRKGGLTVPDKVDEAQVAKVKANTELLQKMGADSVPFILYRNAKTGLYGSHSGTVSTDKLAEMAGV